MSEPTGLRGLLDQATPGPWHSEVDSVLWAGDAMIGGCERHIDARLIALAPEMAALFCDWNEAIEDCAQGTRDPIDLNYIAIRRDAWEILMARHSRFRALDDKAGQP